MQRDLYSNIKRQNFFNAAISTSTTTNGPIVDVLNFYSGSIAYACPQWTDGSYTIQVWESDDSGMSGETQLAAIQILGTIVAISAQLVAGAEKANVGLKWTKRYLRLKVVSTGVSTGARFVADLDMAANQGTINPVLTTSGGS